MTITETNKRPDLDMRVYRAADAVYRHLLNLSVQDRIAVLDGVITSIVDMRNRQAEALEKFLADRRVAAKKAVATELTKIRRRRRGPNT